jgi:hypothetical protein
MLSAVLGSNQYTRTSGTTEFTEQHGRRQKKYDMDEQDEQD